MGSLIGRMAPPTAGNVRIAMASILVIEDEQRIREELAKRLAERGHDVATEGTAMAGVHSAVAGGHDVVILDLGLPEAHKLLVQSLTLEESNDEVYSI